MAKRIDDISLEDLLTVDTHGQELLFIDNTSSKQYKLCDRQTFFSPTGLFADVEANGILIIKDGESSPTNLSHLLDAINSKNHSSVVLIEGFAGCGKSTLVQYILSEQLKTYYYDDSFYDYNLEAQNDLNVKDNEKSSIFEAIKKCFFKQYMKSLKENKSIIQTFNYLLLQCKSFQIFDSLYFDFYITETYQEINQVINTPNNFTAEDYLTIETNLVKQSQQIKSSICIFALDSLLRIAIYNNNPGPSSKLYLCYDNLDAIENANDLKGFDDKLIDYLPAIDGFISYLDFSENFFSTVPIPSFVMMATYRKITASLADLAKAAYKEVKTDKRIAGLSDRVLHIDATSAFKYSKIVKKRKDFFTRYFSNSVNLSSSKRDRLLNAFDSWDKLNQTLAIMNDRYSGLWNKNYRTCSHIANDLYTTPQYQFDECVNMITKSNIHDGYNIESDQNGDNVLCAYYGSSAIILNSVCKVFHSHHIWDDFLELASLTNKNISYKNVSFSRIILTYIYNKGEVSLKELFDTFCKNDLFSSDKLCSILSNMLARNIYGVWRRPIYYADECILSDKVDEIKRNLYLECEQFEKGHKATHNYSFILCDSGKAYVERLMQEFEFFSNRLSNTNKALYLYKDLKTIHSIAESVYQAVSRCCQNMIEFSKQYIRNTGCSIEEYIDLDFHPKTNITKSSQLHTERTIFSHIAYLNNVRLYLLDNNVSPDLNTRKRYNAEFVKMIKQYLDLYYERIIDISSKRRNVADKLDKIVKEIQAEINGNNNNLRILFQSISLH